MKQESAATIVEDKEKRDVSIDFLRIQKVQLIDFMQYLKNYTNTSPVFVNNSDLYDRILDYSYLIPYLINKKDIEPSVIKKANASVSLNFGDIRLLNIVKILGGATFLDSF